MFGLNSVLGSIRKVSGGKSLAIAAAAVALGAAALPAMAGGHCHRGGGYRGGYDGHRHGHRHGTYVTTHVNVYEPTVYRTEPVIVQETYRPLVTERVIVQEPAPILTERVIVQEPAYRTWVAPTVRFGFDVSYRHGRRSCR